MHLEQLYFIAEIVAAIAVVISLIYLAVQVKHSRIQNKTAAMDLLAKQRGEFVNILATNKELSYIVAKGLSGEYKLSNHQYYRFTFFLYNICVNLELAYNKHLSKDLSNEIWKAWDEASQSWFMCPGFQTWWRHNHVGGFTKLFSAYIESSITNWESVTDKKQERILNFLTEIGEHENVNTETKNN